MRSRWARFRKAPLRVKVHLAALAVWALLLIPTLLWWRESILWVAFMSLYANFGAHLGALEAARGSADKPGANNEG